MPQTHACLHYTVATHTHPGKVRENNEDCYGHVQDADGGLVAIVADGMGGHAAGEVASRMAVETVLEQASPAPSQTIPQALQSALLDANERIVEASQSAGRRGMGTTAVLSYFEGRNAWFAHVGDSRIYLFRKGELRWRTKDHTRVQSLVDAGLLTQEAARHHPEGNVLTRALGHRKMADGRALIVSVRERPIHMREGDVVVMCSDGVSDLLEDDDIGRIVGALEPHQAVEQITQLALSRGGHDNITVMVVALAREEVSLGQEPPPVQLGVLPDHSEPILPPLPEDGFDG